MEFDYVLTRRGLKQLKLLALRRRVWFKVLGPVERAILSLVPKCVDRVKSSKLIDVVAEIVTKVHEALRSKFERFRSQAAKSLALKISRIAQKWGNKSAEEWTGEEGFLKYLAIVKMNEISPFC